jgi:hypothetical protein
VIVVKRVLTRRGLLARRIEARSESGSSGLEPTVNIR